jgi:transposase InsO family protein
MKSCRQEAEHGMSWGVKDVKGQRIAFVIRKSAGKERMSDLCREFKISRPTGYKWLRRYQENNKLSELEEQSRRPKHSPGRTAADVENRVIQLRQQTGWGAKKLQYVLERDERIRVGRMTVNRILQRNGLIVEEDRHPAATTRFEMSAPNQLWQMDYKGPFPRGTGQCHPLSVLDDYSRYLIGLDAMSGPQMEPAQRSLIRMFEQYGLPQAMLMDHGSAWWNPISGHGLTRLSVMLIRQGITLKYSGVGHPQTQGKVEKWHDTLRRAVRHRRWLPEQLADWTTLLYEIRNVYNNVRPHEGINMQVPAQRYQRSPRNYQSQPPEWEYPVGSLIKRVDCDGSIRLFGNSNFLSEALIGERVRVEKFGPVALVSYRHMYIREINENGSRPLVCAIGKPSMHTERALEK